MRLLGSSETIRERLEALFAADDYAMCTLDNYAGINASPEARTIDLELPAGAYTLYSDTVAPDVAKAARKLHGRKAPLTLEPRETKADTFIGARETRAHKGGTVKVTIPCNGGFVIVQ